MSTHQVPIPISPLIKYSPGFSSSSFLGKFCLLIEDVEPDARFCALWVLKDSRHSTEGIIIVNSKTRLFLMPAEVEFYNSVAFPLHEMHRISGGSVCEEWNFNLFVYSSSWLSEWVRKVGSCSWMWGSEGVLESTMSKEVVKWLFIREIRGFPRGRRMKRGTAFQLFKCSREERERESDYWRCTYIRCKLL